MAQPIIAALSARIDVLERKVLGHVRRRISRAEKARLMGVTTRTVARHVAAGLLEQPEIINGRWYFWVDEGQPPREIADSSEARAARNPRLRKPARPVPEI